MNEAPSMQLMNEAFKRCPKCKVFIEKSQGCAYPELLALLDAMLSFRVLSCVALCVQAST